MSSLAATTLARLGVRELVIANRTPERAERLAAVLTGPGGVSARAVSMGGVAEELIRADVVVSCTGATGLVLTAESVAAALAEHVVPEAASGGGAGEHLRAPEGSLVARLAATAARDGRVTDARLSDPAARTADANASADPGGMWSGVPSAGDVARTGNPSGFADPARTDGLSAGEAATVADPARFGDTGAQTRGAAGEPEDACPVGPDEAAGPDALTRHGSWVDNGFRAVGRTGTGRAGVRRGGAVRLALLDLAMPRDIDGAVHRLAGVRLVDIESLAEASADAPMAADVDQVRGIVSDEVAAFGAAQRAAHITPTVVALRTMAADVVAGEMARLEGRLTGLDEKQRAEITQTVRRVVDKLLHAPTVRVKQLASEPGGAGYADALRTLFNLDPETVASVSRADLNDADVKNRGRV
jgi:glutamyl-tRNA reductase